MVLLSADIFFQIQFVCYCFFCFFNFGKSVECQAVYIQILPVGPDPGPNCF